MIHLKAIFAVILVGSVLALPLYYYQDFLNQGRSPTRSALVLNEIEKDGLRDFSLPDFFSKSQITLGEQRGKVVLINFWATWCVPCVKEVPSMIGLAHKLSDKLVVLAVSQDKGEDDLNAFLRSFKPLPSNFKILWDPTGEVSKSYGTEVLPESYVVSPHLKLVRKVVGVEVWDHSEAIEFFTDIYQINNGPVPPKAEKN